MKTALVTGAAGFIGFNLVGELLKQGYKVCALIRKNDRAGKDKISRYYPEVQILDDFSKLLSEADSLPCFDRIYHLAAVGVRPNQNAMDLICDVNIKMSCQMIDFAQRNGSGLLVHFGSCFEYGDHGKVLLSEEMQCKPESVYAISKNAATNLVMLLAKSKGVDAITVRPFGVFGKGEAISRLAPSIIRGCLNGKVVETTAGEQIRDFVDVKDLVKAIVSLSEARYAAFEIYNICSGYPVSVKSFIEEIVEVCGLNKSLIEFGSLPYRKNEAMMFVGDNAKLQELIHYPFPQDHRNGIMDIYDELKGDE